LTALSFLFQCRNKLDSVILTYPSGAVFFYILAPETGNSYAELFISKVSTTMMSTLIGSRKFSVKHEGSLRLTRD